MNNEFKIKITNGSNNNLLSLGSITIEAAQSLKVFIDSLADFANTYENPSEFKISLKEGSIESSLVYSSENERVTEDINNILEGRSSNNRRIKLIKNIQDKIKLNGLNYEVLWYTGDDVKNLTELFKGKNFSYRRNHNKGIDEIIFLKGKLFESGGKRSTNIHIEGIDAEYKVECTEQEAIKINGFLYQDIYLSAVKTNKDHNSSVSKLIDYYSNEEEYKKISDLYTQISLNKDLERFDILHDKIYQLIENESLIDIRNIMKVFDNELTERGIIRTILMSLKPIMRNDTFSSLIPLYKGLSDTLRKGSFNSSI